MFHFNKAKIMAKFFHLFCSFLTLTCYLHGQPLNDFEEEFIKIVQNVKSSVVKIKISYSHKTTLRESSGIILNEEGYIVTVASAVKGANSIWVYPDINQRFLAKLIGTDNPTNLALLKIDSKDVKPVERGLSDSLRVGAFLIVFGNPYGLNNSVSTGIVSGLNRCVWSKECKRPLPGLIQTTADRKSVV